METYLDPQQFQKTRFSFRIKIFLIGLGAVIFLLGLGYLLIYSPLLKIKELVVQGNEHLSQESVLAIVKPAVLKGGWANFWGEDHFLAWSKGKIDVSKTALLEASIDKDWLVRSITIQVKERERFGIWCAKDEVCYWMDKEGVVFEEAPLTEGGLILKVYDSQRTELVLGSPAIEGRFVENLMAILESLPALNVSVDKIVFDQKLQELKIDTYDGPAILFSIRFDPALNIKSLEKLSETLDFQKIDHVDLRVENRIYYKNK